MTGLSLLLFPQRTFPCDHAMLETVYSRLLPERGYRVNWIMRSGQTHHSTASASWNGTPVHVLPTSDSRVPAGRALAACRQIGRALAIAESVHRQDPLALVQVRNEFTGACVALRLRARLGIPFVFQLSAPLTDFNLWVPDVAPVRRRVIEPLKAGLRRRLQWQILKRADLVFAISECMRRELVSQGLDADKVIAVPLGVDTAVRPGDFDRARVRLALGLRDAPTVIYFGAMDRLRRLDFLLDTILRVRVDVPNVHLLMVGSALHEADYEWLLSACRARGLAGATTFVRNVPRASIPQYLAASDVSVAPIPPLPIYTLSSPTKVVESLGMARPVVGNCEIIDQHQLIEDSGGGRSVPYEVGAFAATIAALLRDPAEACRAGYRGYEYVVRTRSYAHLAARIDAEYRRLIARSSPDAARDRLRSESN